MTPLQGEPARESNRTLYQPTSFNMGLEKFPKQIQHELSGVMPNEKFCQVLSKWPSVALLELLRLKPTTSLCLPVVELERELEVQQRLDTLTCFDDHQIF